MPPSSSGVIIDISENTHPGIARYYGGHSKLDVKLEKLEFPKGSGFWKFKHVKNGGKPFKIANVTYKDNESIQLSELQINDHDDIKHLAVWYWNNDPDLGAPLLIEIFKNGLYTYHYNKGNNEWRPLPENPYSKTPLSGKPLEAQLEYLNCQHYKSVILDLSKNISEGTRTYCCVYHNTRHKVTVSKDFVTVDSSSLPFYKHHIGVGTTLSGIKYYLNGETNDKRGVKLSGYPFPIPDVKAVYAVYCKDGAPKLLYIEKTKGTGWFKQNTSDIWIEVLDGVPGPDKTGKGGSSDGFKQLVGALNDAGCLSHQPLSPQTSSSGVTINIKQHTAKPGSTIYPSGSGFWKFIHIKNSPGDQSFEVEKVIFGDNSKDITREIGISPNDKITQLSVWYWKGDQGMTNPLLVEVLKDGKYTYTSNKGGGGNNLTWQQLPRRDSESYPLQGEALEQELDNLNCYNNNVVTLNLSLKNPKTYRNGHSYCCKEHGCGREKVSVSKDFITVGSSPIPYLKHEVDQNSKVAAIKYNDSKGDRKRITSNGLQFPIDGPTSISVFYCQRKPVLIHVESNGNPRIKSWYKQRDGDTWEETLNGAPNPDEIDDGFKQLVEELRSVGCRNLKTHAEPSKPSSRPGIDSDPGLRGPKGEKDPQTITYPAIPTPEVRQEASPGSSEVPQTPHKPAVKETASGDTTPSISNPHDGAINPEDQGKTAKDTTDSASSPNLKNKLLDLLDYKILFLLLILLLLLMLAVRRRRRKKYLNLLLKLLVTSPPTESKKASTEVPQDATTSLLISLVLLSLILLPLKLFLP
ncbi:hypothetical protein BEWA_013740 [Theileria equi strain WA]|uniref:Uncharacterized protein n=1 Tax=Theileria equi strain WA TaxID=1537102 RepID=L1LC50_THEEQ|nr:hypothetical protein BEWA_013740 [Theileria equi strain WA]EKX72815.1 hypothetical protein BEWA_013740 [Theileria equi strain WA]|eukprot:XP_004832267.1 hypothetical protein BEWA_013740 [Theileria equi strain WA]